MSRTGIIRPKFAVGDIVQIVASGIQGEVTAVDEERDLYVVKCRSFTGTYTRPMLKFIERPSVQLDPDSGLPNWLHKEIQDALGGDSNDAEHDALAAVAGHFGIQWSDPDNEIDADGNLRGGLYSKEDA